MATEHGSARLAPELKQAAGRWPHLKAHLLRMKQETGEFPKFVDEPTKEYKCRRPNILYHVGGPVYCQVYGDLGVSTRYHAIEPELSPTERELFAVVKARFLERSVTRATPTTTEEYEDHIVDILDDVVRITDTEPTPFDRVQTALGIGDVEVTRETYQTIKYRLLRDIVGLGPLEPVMRDTANEDIHVIGPRQVDVVHGVFGLIETDIEFDDEAEFDNWLRNMGERIGSPVSDAHPIVDSTLPDGSRINIIYSDDVSLKGPSLTIRQGEEVPLSVFQLTDWGTLSPELAAYLWMALENERTIFVVGETASGKTTTLNAMLSFIPRDSKIFTAEDTAEVLPPHNTWQQLLTRKGSDESDSGVDLFDLVAAALRSRPDYIIVGEVRGEEGRMAFQAAQTGHPVILTFHASNVVSMIQRFTGDPIRIPETFMNNCDIALFQNRVKRGEKTLRRVTSVHEIEGYSKEMGGVVTREVFYWDPVKDEIVFQGMNNSFVLEQKIATLLGYADTREIYDDVRTRAQIIERSIAEGIVGYHEVNDLIESYQRDGTEGLPFTFVEDDGRRTAQVV
jgi:flagellar protein FlaI